jgi:hypothetical protein
MKVDWTGRAIAQAVSRRLPTAAARVRSQVRSCGICGGQSGTEADFLRVLQFPPTPPHSSSSIIRSWYNRPVSGRCTKWTRSHFTRRDLIRRRKLTAWPPPSPDLTPMDCFLRGHLKEQYLRSRGKISSSCNNGRCQNFNSCYRKCCTAHCRLP